MTKSPLAGLKVLVTRPRDQATYLATQIERGGGIPLLFPLLEIAAVTDTLALQQQISRLPQTHLVIFISPNAVQYGMAAIHASGVLLKGDMPKIATVGKGSAKALHALGIVDVLVPEARFDSEGLLDLPELQQLEGWNVMIFRGDGGRELLGDTLRARGAQVDYVTCYCRSKPRWSANELVNAGPDIITVTSSEALRYLTQMLATELESARAAEFLALPLLVPHPRIAESASLQGWQDVHLTASGDDGMLAALFNRGAE